MNLRKHDTSPLPLFLHIRRIDGEWGMNTYEHDACAMIFSHSLYALSEYERENRKVVLSRVKNQGVRLYVHEWVCRAWCVQCVHRHIHARIHTFYIHIYTHIHRNMYACNHFKYIIVFSLSDTRPASKITRLAPLK